MVINRKIIGIVLKLFSIWLINATVLGGLTGIVLGTLGTGHLPFFSAVLLFAEAGFFFGIIGGFLFVCLYAWRLRHGDPGTKITIIGGMVIGVISAFFTDRVFGLTWWFLVGAFAGLVIASFCFLRSKKWNQSREKASVSVFTADT